MCTGSEVFVISGHRFCRQPLEKQQIEFRSRPDEARQQGVDLAAVAGLVVEPMRQRHFVRFHVASVSTGSATNLRPKEPITFRTVSNSGLVVPLHDLYKLSRERPVSFATLVKSFALAIVAASSKG